MPYFFDVFHVNKVKLVFNNVITLLSEGKPLTWVSSGAISLAAIKKYPLFFLELFMKSSINRVCWRFFINLVAASMALMMFCLGYVFWQILVYHQTLESALYMLLFGFLATILLFGLPAAFAGLGYMVTKE